MEYIICMENEDYKVELSENKSIAISDLEQMLDNMINLCKMYNIEEEEILNELVCDTCLEIEKNNIKWFDLHNYLKYMVYYRCKQKESDLNEIKRFDKRSIN